MSFWKEWNRCGSSEAERRTTGVDDDDWEELLAHLIVLLLLLLLFVMDGRLSNMDYAHTEEGMGTGRVYFIVTQQGRERQERDAKILAEITRGLHVNCAINRGGGDSQSPSTLLLRPYSNNLREIAAKFGKGARKTSKE